MSKFPRPASLLIVSLCIGLLSSFVLGKSARYGPYDRDALIFINVFHLVVTFDQPSYGLDDLSVRKTWLRLESIVTRSVGGTAPHELGHQFGIRGDNDGPTPTGEPKRTSNTYRIMDYFNYRTEPINYNLHPEHMNLIRRRISSPGQQ